MNQRTLRRLEYHRVIERLEGAAGSALGKEIAAALTPVDDLTTIQQWQEETKEAKDILRLYPELPLGGIRDVRGALRKVAIGGVLEPTELLEVADTIYAARRLANFLTGLKENFPAIQELAGQLGNFRQIEEEIKRCILEDGEVADAASANLGQARRQIRGAQGRIRERIDGILRSAQYQKMLQETIVTIRGDRYVVPVKHEYRSQFSGIVHDQSASGATLYIEPMAVVEINNELRQFFNVEKQEIVKILTNLSHLLRDELEEFKDTLQLLGKLDFIFAKGKLSHSMDASEPKLNDRGYVNIIKGRHPLIAGKVVPVSIWLGKDFDVLVITGPNTGGKTVTLKTIGLFALMAQSGLQIPAEPNSELPIYSNIFCDIGDEQSIEQSLSTFSGHMTNIVNILAESDARSLVMLDELGAGTDPTEGAALAIAILEELLQRGTKVIATTHYSELKNFAYNQPRVENASVEFDVETLRPTYRLLIGRPGRSNAFEIATRLGLAVDIVEKAKGHMTQEQIEVANLFAKLELNQRQAEREREAAEKLRKELEDQRTQYQRLQNELAEKKANTLAKADEEAWQIISQARREAEGIIDELKAAAAKEAKINKDYAIQQARAQLGNLSGKAAKRRAAQADQAPGQVPSQIKPGQTIFVPKLNQKGQVLSSNGQDVQIQVGIMKLTVKLKELRTVAEQKVTAANTGAGKLMATKARHIERELDLRGLMVDEAIPLVDKYLDDAYLAGVGQVTLIHGKGTGALRSAVQDMIARHPHVKTSRLGEYGEGGMGVTVVQIQ